MSMLFSDDPEGDIINESGNYIMGHHGMSNNLKLGNPNGKKIWQLNHQVHFSLLSRCTGIVLGRIASWRLCCVVEQVT